jgi:hypothetical protein
VRSTRKQRSRAWVRSAGASAVDRDGIGLIAAVEPHDPFCGLGVTRRFVQNRTLNDQGLERRNEPRIVAKSRGWVRLGPDVVAGQTDMREHRNQVDPGRGHDKGHLG